MASVKGSKVSAGETVGFLYVGPFVHSIGLCDLQIIEEGVIAVTNGKICAVDSKDNLNRVAEKFGISEQNFHFLDNGEFLIPGFVDTHIHAPQYPNAGLGYDKPLLGWLDHYTFPMEAKYSDERFAETIYNAVVKKTLSYGTTTACYFATIHVASAIILADIVLKHGQRAFVGKVNMNVNHPSYYGESSENSLKDTETFVNAILSKKNDLIKPIITPRFAISCDMELMKKLSDIAKKHDVHIQTHISENKDEIKYVAELFPECKSYADVYDSAGLLTDKTILAHGVYLTDDEIKTIVKRSSSVSHCPTSNSCLRSGICHVRRLLQNGVQVGLGTDISGGYSPSIIEVMKAALAVSIDLSFEKDKSNQQSCALDLKEVFYLATLGGARALRLDNKIGNFEIGKEFDALVVSLRGEPGGVDILTPLSTAELLQKFVYLGDDRNVKKVYVSGKIVKQI